MTTPTANSCVTDGSDFAESTAILRAPLLTPILALSLLLHVAIIVFWPPASAMDSAAVPAARVAMQLQLDLADIHHATLQPSAVAQATASTSNRQHNKPVQHTQQTTRKLSHPISTVRSITTASATGKDAAIAASLVSPIAGHIQTSTTAMPETGEALHKRLRHSLQRALVAYFEYPLIARRRGWAGVVHVGVRVGANGQLSQLRLVATSGHALLDRDALRTLERVNSLPETVGWLHGRQMDMILPVRYRLIDG